MERSDGKVWYLPRHSVYQPTKKKIRVVFDCGASFQGTSLNAQLLQGSNLKCSLVGVVGRFRKELVVIMADMESMFHQVRVPAEDAVEVPLEAKRGFKSRPCRVQNDSAPLWGDILSQLC